MVRLRKVVPGVCISPNLPSSQPAPPQVEPSRGPFVPSRSQGAAKGPPGGELGTCHGPRGYRRGVAARPEKPDAKRADRAVAAPAHLQIGREQCRARVCKAVKISVVAVYLKKKQS